MGSSGIRRRKPFVKRRRTSESDLGWPSDDETPPVMWSAAGGGFEASSFSPAGQAQRSWWFARRWGRMSWRQREKRAGTAVRWALPAMALYLAVVAVVQFVLGGTGGLAIVLLGLLLGTVYATRRW